MDEEDRKLLETYVDIINREAYVDLSKLTLDDRKKFQYLMLCMNLIETGLF